MAMPLSPTKPKLVFLQWDHQPNQAASGFLALHMQHHVKCLSAYFDVVVIAEDCDYDAVCDRHEPDLVLFESGYRTHGSRRVQISNTRTHPGIPKLGLHNGDPWCDRRSGFLADMETWGIETFFAIGTCTPEYTPTIADRTFVWPNFIDPEMFRDYGLQKVVPVMLTGQAYSLYPWRERIYAKLSENYPCLITPPFQYESAAAARMLSGERYARALNASWVSPSCGTMGHELVRKHLEIPGSACLLVAEHTPILDAAGFVDGENCVFADADDVVGRLDALFADQDRMRAIIAAGHRLVHARHTLRNRPQIREWYELNRSLRPGQRIVQPGPFLPLTVVVDTPKARSGHVVGRGLDRIALERADKLLDAGQPAEARAAYTEALHYVPYLPEGRFGLARCDLAQGRPEDAARELAGLIEITTVHYGAAFPDPVEWAFYLVALVCAGREAEAVALRNRYRQLRHGELAQVQRLLDGIAGKGSASAGPDQPPSGRPTSIHDLPPRDFEAFRRWVAEVQAACRSTGAAVGDSPGASLPRRGSRRRAPDAWLRWLDAAIVAVGADRVRPNVPPGRDFRYGHRVLETVARSLIRGQRARQFARRARDSLLSLSLLRGGATGRRI